MTDPITIMIQVMWPFVALAAIIIAGVFVWHIIADEHRPPSVTVRDFLDAAKARQFGQPRVEVEVFDHFDPRNDVEVVR